MSWMTGHDCMDRCPRCGEEHQGYNDLEFDRDEIYLRFTCGKCGWAFVEVYKYWDTECERFEPDWDEEDGE